LTPSFFRGVGQPPTDPELLVDDFELATFDIPSGYVKIAIEYGHL